MPRELPGPPDRRLPLAPPLGTRLTRSLALAAVALAVALALAGVDRLRPVSGAPLRADPPDPGLDPTEALGQNAACLVCHLTFVKEDLARTHQLKGVACTRCHGPSIKHANDENIGASKPDMTFTRAKIDAACAGCHKHHNAPARVVVARFLERHLPLQSAPTCTDCHGTHRIEKASKPSPG